MPCEASAIYPLMRPIKRRFFGLKTETIWPAAKMATVKKQPMTASGRQNHGVIAMLMAFMS